MAALVATAAGGSASDVTLEIRNAGSEPLRCVLVLAHFVSTDLAPVPAGGSLSLVLERDGDAGTLGVRRRDGRAMMVENLLCGASRRWQDTRGEVPLLPLRTATPEHMATQCRIEARLACSEPAPLP